MGLDVYLYRYDDRAKTKKAEDLYERESESNWNAVGNYDRATEDQKKAVLEKNDALKKELGYVDYHPPGEEQIEIPSVKYPDHYFKIGYFRSSYNDGGIERVVGDLLGVATSGRCLYYIFEPGYEYEFQPDWDATLDRTREVIRLFDEKTKNGSYRCLSEGANMFRSPSEYSGIEGARAMEIFAAARREGSYSNINGAFFFDGDGLKVRALIPGIRLGGPCIHVIYESDLSWYRQALEIVEETILWVTARKDIEKFYLYWSS